MVTLLAYRAWYDLRSTAHAHNLPFNSHQSKAQVRARLYQQLVETATLRRCLKRLGRQERGALAALQASGGTMAAARFARVYGTVRIWRPWRSDVARQPWKSPVSVCDRLWHWGLIERVPGCPDQIVLPDEVARLLPPLPRPKPVPLSRDVDNPWSLDMLCLDLAHLLGFLLRENVRPLHGRWVSLSALRRLNGQLRVSECLGGIRSELQTSRLRWLHYLAEAAGLIAVQGGYLKPTRAAWRWLDADSAERHRMLCEATTADVGHPERSLWERYRLPPMNVSIWTGVNDILGSLQPGQAYPTRWLAETVRHSLPASEDADESILCLLNGPLSWLSRAAVSGNLFQIPTLSAPPQAADVSFDSTEIVVRLPQRPHLRPLVECLAWGRGEQQTIRVDADAAAAAVAQGLNAAAMLRTLAELTETLFPRAVLEQLERWTHAAQALTLRTMAILTAADSQTLAAVRSDWRLRPLFGELLSAHHLAVPVQCVEPLTAALSHRGHAVTRFERAPIEQSDHAVSSELAAYLWLAVRVYQKLGAVVETPVHLPGAALDWLTAQLDDGVADGLDADVSVLIETLARQMDGRCLPASSVACEDPAAVRAAVHAAYENRTPVSVEYFSPARGERTTRTITPTMLFQRSGAEYVEAWCELEGAPRTFRVDRILRIVDEDQR